MHADILSELVRPSIDYVRHKKFRSGNFPSSLSNESDRLVHWCHGAPGVLHMLLMAYQVCRELYNSISRSGKSSLICINNESDGIFVHFGPPASLKDIMFVLI